MRAGAHACTYIYIYIYMYVCMYVCMYVYICIHAHIHTLHSYTNRHAFACVRTYIYIYKPCRACADPMNVCSTWCKSIG